jgi:hypothetical protein
MSVIAIIVVLFVTVASAWIWLRRRSVLRKLSAHKYPAVEQPPTADLQAIPLTEFAVPASVTTNEPHEQTGDAHHQHATESSAPAASHETAPTASEIVEPASVPADTVEVPPFPPAPQPLSEPGSEIPVGPPLTSVGISCLSSNESILRKHDATVREPEHTLISSPSPPVSSFGEEEISAPSEASKNEPFVPQTEAPVMISIAATNACELAAQTTIVDENRGELAATVPASGPEVESDTCEGERATTGRKRRLHNVREFSEPKPPPTTKIWTKTQRKPDSKPRPETSLPIRLQLVFGCGGTVKTLALVPHRREGMPSSIDVTPAYRCSQLSEWSADCYEPVSLPDAAHALSQGVVWQADGGAQRWRWELTKREIYVLAAGDEFGLHGFVTRRKDQRLWLNTRHVVLAKAHLREQVFAALAEAGCATPEASDDTTTGVPPGWILFRDVTPTRAVPMRDERDILNVLCPAHENEPQFVGGIRLERNVWLAGFPPGIRISGELGRGFQVLIDGQPAQLSSDGAFESPGWDAEGEHRLWFGDRTETYSLRTIEEEWDSWHAYDFGTGAAICGAITSQIDATRRRQVRIPVSNLLLIGARPGEIFHCHPRSDVRCETVLAMVSFTPVWALPFDPAHADKKSAQILLLQPSEPQTDSRIPKGDRAANRRLLAWIAAIREAACKGLRLAQEDEQAKVLWQCYQVVAKQLRRRMR